MVRDIIATVYVLISGDKGGFTVLATNTNATYTVNNNGPSAHYPPSAPSTNGNNTTLAALNRPSFLSMKSPTVPPPMVNNFSALSISTSKVRTIGHYLSQFSTCSILNRLK